MKYLTKFLLVIALVVFLQNEPPKHSHASVNLNKQAVATVDSKVKIQPATPSVKQKQAKVSEPVATPVQQPVAEPVPIPEPVVAPASNRAIGQEMAAQKGWQGDQWLCLEKLWTNESNWQTHIPNQQGSGAYGIAQALPASKMSSHGADYLTNPRTQIAWGIDYISSRYQTPCAALSFWNNQYPHWY